MKTTKSREKYSKQQQTKHTESLSQILLRMPLQKAQDWPYPRNERKPNTAQDSKERD